MHYKRIMTPASNNLCYFDLCQYNNQMINQSNFICLHHGSLVVQDLEQAIYFYCQVIGLEQDRQRPDMDFSGVWLNIGAQQIHLLALSATEQAIEQPEHAGKDRHLAIHVRQIETIKEKLMTNNISFTMSRSGRKALFCRDPDGNGLEFIAQC